MVWRTLPIFDFSKFPIFSIENIYKKAFSEVLMLGIGSGMSQISPGVPSGTLGTPGESKSKKLQKVKSPESIRIPRKNGPPGP